MNIGFPKVDENYIKSQVEKGYFANETEVVRAAIRAKREAEERQDNFRAAIRIGAEQTALGKGILFTDELMDNIEQTAIRNAESGKAISNPDVIPK
ncbi:MAG: type II toxin-antitoxin system ParD family antitoxin [Rickettsiales bacterium]